MTIFNKHYKTTILNSFKIEDFVEIATLFQSENYDYSLSDQINLICTHEFGLNFDELWKNSEIIEKIEIIFFLHDWSKGYFDPQTNLTTMERFFNSSRIKSLLNKINHYIIAGGLSEVRTKFKEWEVSKIVKKESKIILDTIKELDTNLEEQVIKFYVSKSSKEKELALFSIQKPYNKFFNKKLRQFSAININVLRGKINIYCRHSDEINPNKNPIKLFYNSLTEQEKINELEILLTELLSFIKQINI